MSYLSSHNWSLYNVSQISYLSASLADVGKPIKSYEKTYIEGVSVVRSIHNVGEKHLVVSSIESQTSGPAESVEHTATSLNEAEYSLNDLCKEDDQYYK